VTQADPAGVWIPTSTGAVKVDVIEVSDTELAHLPEDETDRLAVLSHAWAIETAMPLRIRAASPEGASTEVVAHVAEPGPLIAMKLQSIMNRTVNKERTDLLDIVRLTWITPQVRQHVRSLLKLMRNSLQTHVFMPTGGSLTARTRHSASSAGSRGRGRRRGCRPTRR
jgi:hypothetical protein